jgi:hypothetical protein
VQGWLAVELFQGFGLASKPIILVSSARRQDSGVVGQVLGASALLPHVCRGGCFYAMLTELTDACVRACLSYLELEEFSLSLLPPGVGLLCATTRRCLCNLGCSHAESRRWCHMPCQVNVMDEVV